MSVSRAPVEITESVTAIGLLNFFEGGWRGLYFSNRAAMLAMVATSTAIAPAERDALVEVLDGQAIGDERAAAPLLVLFEPGGEMDLFVSPQDWSLVLNRIRALEEVAARAGDPPEFLPLA